MKHILYTSKNWRNGGLAIGSYKTREEAEKVALEMIREKKDRVGMYSEKMHLACDFVIAIEENS